MKGSDIMAEKAYKYRIYPNKQQEELIQKLLVVQDLCITIILINEKNIMKRIRQHLHTICVLKI